VLRTCTIEDFPLNNPALISLDLDMRLGARSREIRAGLQFL
jgi:hypothetical protein